TVTVTNVNPTVEIDKTGPATISEGQTATYSFTITNTSPAVTDPITVTSVVDDVLGDLTPFANAEWAAEGNTGPIVLAKGDTFTFTFTTGPLSPGSYTNTVKVISHDDENTPASGTDSHTLVVTNVPPEISVDKTVASIAEGNPATYHFTITNISS